MKKENKIYRVVHYFAIDNDETSIYVESPLEINDFIRLLGAISFKFEELVDESLSMDEQHLASIFEQFYNYKNVTKEYHHLSSYLQLDKEKWETATVFDLVNSEDEILTIIQIDWYEAREQCCGTGYRALMDEFLPKSIDFDVAIQNKSYYRELQPE